MGICRVCGENIHQYECMDRYANIYLQLASVQFHAHEDQQLLKICFLCIEKLQSFDKFRNNCLKVHWQMHNVKIEPIEKHQEDDDNNVEDSIEPFETVGVSASIKTEFLPEEDTAFQVKKQRAKYGSLKKQPRLPLSCDRCPEVFQEILQLNAHRRIHDGLLPFVCEICNLDFNSLLDMQLHNVKNHTEGQSIPCDHPGCQEIFSSYQGLRSHRFKTHDPNYVEPEPSTFICEVCAKTYTTKESLKRHRYSHSPEEMPNVCSFCPRRFSTVHALKQHLNRHNGVKNHICPYCGVRKTTKNELRSHINNIHKKDQPQPFGFDPSLYQEPLNLVSDQPIIGLENSSEPKRSKNEDNWKRSVRKQNRNSGKAYISTNNVLVPGKSFPENFDCECPKKCPSLFSSQTILQDFFNSYWDLADWHKQNALLRDMVKSVEITRRRSKTADQSARSRNLHYFIPDGPDKVRVCKSYFLGILQISWGRVYRRIVRSDEQKQ